MYEQQTLIIFNKFGFCWYYFYYDPCFITWNKSLSYYLCLLILLINVEKKLSWLSLISTCLQSLSLITFNIKSYHDERNFLINLSHLLQFELYSLVLENHISSNMKIISNVELLSLYLFILKYYILINFGKRIWTVVLPHVWEIKTLHLPFFIQNWINLQIYQSISQILSALYHFCYSLRFL